MQFINALSLTSDVNEWLANSSHPRILHVFDHACNLINERREVLSIVTPQIGNGPFNLVLEADVLFSDHLNAQSPISIHTNQLDLGDLTIITSNTKLWSPHPNWDMLHVRRNDIINQIMSLRESHFPAPKAERYVTKQSSPSDGDCSSALANTALAMILPIINYQFSNSLLSSLANADLSSSLVTARQLTGLGQGLTPAGDDFILGAVLAVWIIHPLDIASVIAKEVTNAAASLTTSLSAAYLKSAGRGETGILWHTFFDALSIGDLSAIESQITKLLSIGHTSGTDALAGFLGTFISYAESEKKSCLS